MRGYPECLHEVISADLQESTCDESLEEMEVHYFSQSELDCLHDTVYNSVGVKLNNDELVDLIHTTPDNIKEIGYEFGLCDTVFSDMMFAWLRQIYNELAIGLRNKATTYSLMALVNEIGNTNDVKEPLLKQYMKLIKG